MSYKKNGKRRLPLGMREKEDQGGPQAHTIALSLEPPAHCARVLTSDASARSASPVEAAPRGCCRATPLALPQRRAWVATPERSQAGRHLLIGGSGIKERFDCSGSRCCPLSSNGARGPARHEGMMGHASVREPVLCARCPLSLTAVRGPPEAEVAAAQNAARQQQHDGLNAANTPQSHRA